MLAPFPRAKPAPPSPARQALAEAIADHQARVQESSGREEAFRKARSSYWTARAARDEAQAALEAAPSATIAHMTAAACGTAGETPVSVSKARASLVEAEETVVSAKLVLNAIQQSTPVGLEVASTKLASAVAAAIRESPELKTMITEVAEAQRELIEKAAPLAFLLSKNVLRTDKDARGSPEYEVFRRMQMPPNVWDAWRDNQSSIASLWASAYDALMADPAAPLPSAK